MRTSQKWLNVRQHFCLVFSLKVLAVRFSTLSHHHMGLLQYCSTSAVKYLEGEGMLTREI